MTIIIVIIVISYSNCSRITTVQMTELILLIVNTALLLLVNIMCMQ